MRSGAWIYSSNPEAAVHDRHTWPAAIIAILFAVVAALSFVVDQSVTVSNPPSSSSAGR
jgi:hypothetical protein